MVHLGPHEQRGDARPQGRHDREDRVALAQVADEAAEGPREAERDDEDEEDLDEVGQAVGVLERMGRVGVVEAAAVGPQLLDGLLARHRAARNRLRTAGQGGEGGVAGEVLHDAADEQDDGEGHGDGQQYAKRDAREVDPEVAEAVRARAGQAADQCDRYRDAHGGGQEVLHGQSGHLRRVAESSLARVRLPVGVGHEADGGVERLQRRHALAVERVRQVGLQPQQREEDDDRDDREGEDGAQVRRPALVRRRVNADQAIDASLDARMPR